MFNDPQLDAQFTAALLSILTTLVTAAILALARWMHRTRKEHEREREMAEEKAKTDSETLIRIADMMEKMPSVADGVRLLLRAELVQLHRKYMELGTIGLEDREYVERLYCVYHSLGGNGVGTTLHDDLVQLPVDRSKR